MIVCQKKLYYTKKLQKQAKNKDVKPRNYTFNNKIWLNGKFIKTKCKPKLDLKFFKPFHVFYLVRKQIYKLEFYRKQRIDDIFNILILEQDKIKKWQVNKNVKLRNFDISGNKSKKYKVEAI